MLRDYQQSACNAALSWVKRSTDPCIIECPTGSGKSHIASELALCLIEMSKGKKVLVLAPNGKLVYQNYKKWLATGSPASIFCAKLNEKCTKHKVIFGSPVSVSNSLGRFKRDYCAVILDEAHGITKTVKRIIEGMREGNPNMRVIGMSATPYRTGDGYVYKHHYKYGPVRDDQRLDDAFFHTLVYSIDPRYLIEKGYLTKPVFDHADTHYDTSGLVKNRMGNWDSDTVDRAFVGRGRLTAEIVADVVSKSKYRRGVMLFAATIQHAQEIFESLPRGISAVITGQEKDNDKNLADFENQKLKYIVSVEMLTTGYDAPHVDVIAVLRKTESPGLLQQIIGRGARLYDGKEDFLVLDYAENIEYHFPHGDVFEPEIRAYKSGGSSGELEVTCPDCGGVNFFSARKNEEGYTLTDDGYFADLAGEKICNLEGVPIPSHYGRRCTNEQLIKGVHVQCSYRWSHKVCPECGGENDIAAKYCSSCRAELVDPNEKLAIEAARIASDPYRLRIEPVLTMNIRRWPSKYVDKPDTIRVDYGIAEKPELVSEWYSPESSSAWMLSRWVSFTESAWPGRDIRSIDDAMAMKHDAVAPKNVAFRKKSGSKFYEVTAKEW